MLNLVDALLTLIWIDNGVADEGNVFMRLLVDIDPMLFLFVKVVVFTGFVIILWRLKGEEVIDPSMSSFYIIIFFYYLILLWHLYILGNVLSRG